MMELRGDREYRELLEKLEEERRKEIEGERIEESLQEMCEPTRTFLNSLLYEQVLDKVYASE